jgi:hypothetical protein
MSVVIGLLGKKGSGKSTAAQCIARAYDAHELTFAAPLKEIAHVFGFTEEECHGTQAQKEQPNKFWGVSFRQFATICGTELFRQQLPAHLPQMTDCWVRLLEQRLTQLKNAGGLEVIVVSDVRFQNEADCVQRAGGILIRIDRHDDQPDGQAMHASETEQDSIAVNYTINNHGTKDYLSTALEEIIDQHLPQIDQRGAFKMFAVILIAMLAAYIAAMIFRTPDVIDGGHSYYDL